MVICYTGLKTNSGIEKAGTSDPIEVIGRYDSDIDLWVQGQS